MITQANGMRMTVLRPGDATAARNQLVEDMGRATSQVQASQLTPADHDSIAQVQELQRAVTVRLMANLDGQASAEQSSKTDLLQREMRSFERQLYASRGISVNGAFVTIGWVSNRVPPELAGRGIDAIHYELTRSDHDFSLAAEAENCAQGSTAYSLTVSGQDNCSKTEMRYLLLDHARGQHDSCEFNVSQGQVRYLGSTDPTIGPAGPEKRAFLSAVAGETGLSAWMAPV